MGGEGLGPAFRGPLYFVLIASFIAISYFLSTEKDFYHYEFTPPQVFGASDVMASDGIKITKIDAGTGIEKVPGCIMGRFSFWADITSNGPGTILYNWEGDTSAEMSIPLTFEKAETKRVSTDWQVYGPGNRLMKLHVFSPNNISSPLIPFELLCP